MILVAISIVALLAMAALAIDVVTLYVASSEIKRAADAAALAAAKGIADSGVTTLCAAASAPCTAQDPNFLSAQTLATNMANAAITAILAANTVAGSAPSCTNCPVAANWSNQGNPTVTVSLKQTNLSTFFARIWGKTGSTVTASSTAEAYNPSNNSSYTPIAPVVVKPWLVANLDPDQGGAQFIQSSNLVESGVIGEGLYLAADCQPFSFNPPCTLNPGAITKGQYVPAQVTSNAGNNVCPSSCLGASDFEQSIECADVATTYSCGAGGASWDQSVYPGGASGPTPPGVECLIHAGGTGPNVGQDTLNVLFPNGPPQITTNSGPYSGYLVSTSSSIVTLPIVDPASVSQGNPSVTVVGFMQVFINWVDPVFFRFGGNINVTVLNIAGCYGSSNGNPPVVGGRGTSPVAVRLIAPTS